MPESYSPDFSIVVLSFNRPDAIKRNISEILRLHTPNIEIIVVDNNSEIPVESVLGENSNQVRIIRLDQNQGVGGRNAGIEASSGQFVVTLDDDVFGLTDEALCFLVKRLNSNDKIGAINFKVIDDVTEEQINWCHHRKVEEWKNSEFSTYEISEGAVAFRKTALNASGLYPDYFFISHEGPDLALRLMNGGYEVLYCPQITVRHAHAPEARPSWRRYFYDTRNVIWLSVRCYSVSMGVRKLPVALGALLFYSIRDGYFIYWFKGIIEAVLGLKAPLKDRVVISHLTWERYKEIEKKNASIWHMIKVRVFRKNIRI